jgi:hypothetical protein
MRSDAQTPSRTRHAWESSASDCRFHILRATNYPRSRETFSRTPAMPSNRAGHRPRARSLTCSVPIARTIGPRDLSRQLAASERRHRPRDHESGCSGVSREEGRTRMENVRPRRSALLVDRGLKRSVTYPNNAPDCPDLSKLSMWLTVNLDGQRDVPQTPPTGAYTHRILRAAELAGHFCSQRCH